MHLLTSTQTRLLHLLISRRLPGHLLFWGGLTVGACNLICGAAVGVTGANAAVADAADPQLFVKILIVEVFSSILGLFGLIIGLILTSRAKDFGTEPF